MKENIHPPLYKISVLGCCVTRDSFNSKFNKNYKELYEVISHQNQTSIIGLMAKSIEVQPKTINLDSEYDRTHILSEFHKKYLEELKINKPDILVIDLFADAYFGVLKYKDSFITNNTWKITKTDFFKNTQSLTKFTAFTNEKEYWLEWTKAVDNFFNFLKKECPNTLVCLNGARLCNRYSVVIDDLVVIKDGYNKSQYVPNIKIQDIDAINNYWRKLDLYIVENYDIPYFEFDHENYYCNSKHIWGPFYVHYGTTYYNDFMKKLNHALLLSNRYKLV